jgi:hypothetical protein
VRMDISLPPTFFGFIRNRVVAKATIHGEKSQRENNPNEPKFIEVHGDS